MIPHIWAAVAVCYDTFFCVQLWYSESPDPKLSGRTKHIKIGQEMRKNALVERPVYVKQVIRRNPCANKVATFQPDTQPMRSYAFPDRFLCALYNLIA